MGSEPLLQPLGPVPGFPSQSPTPGTRPAECACACSVRGGWVSAPLQGCRASCHPPRDRRETPSPVEISPQRALRGQGGEAGGVGRSGSGPALRLTSRVAVGELFHPPASAHSPGKGGLALKFSDLGKPPQRVAEGKIDITARNCNQRSTTAFSRVEP